MERRQFEPLRREINHPDFQSVPQAKIFAKKWGWQGWILDVLAQGDERLFQLYLTYPWGQLLMMGVRQKEIQELRIAEHDKRKQEQKAETAKAKARK